MVLRNITLRPKMLSTIPKELNPPVFGNRYLDTCKGDSGGPLMYQHPKTGRFYLLGTLQGGEYDCNNDSFIFNKTRYRGDGMWSQVSLHTEWIAHQSAWPVSLFQPLTTWHFLADNTKLHFFPARKLTDYSGIHNCNFAVKEQYKTNNRVS